LASGFFVRVIQLEGAISPSGVPVFVADPSIRHFPERMDLSKDWRR